MGANIHTESQTVDIRRRITDSAAGMFAAKGFDRTSVREITDHAGCNVAAINYHFGGKYNLYLDIFRERLTLLREVRIGAINNLMDSKADGVKLEELIEVFARAFFQPLLDAEDGKVLMQLMWREMSEPHLPEELFFDEVVGPTTQTLRTAMSKICPKLNSEQIQLCIESFISQLIYVVMMQKLIPSHGADVFNAAYIDDRIKHIVLFTAAGIKSMEASGKS